MRSTLDRVMPHVFAHEGGYVDHPSDPGGATNMGITRATLEDWRGEPVSKADVKALTKSEATAIYRARYWNAIKGDELAAGVDYAVFDFAINSGPSRAARHLQAIVGAKIDAVIGPQTIAAANSRTASSVVNELCDSRLAFLHGLGTWGTFGKGWERRVSEVRSVALQLASAPPSPPDIPPSEPVEKHWLVRLIEAFLSLFKRIGR